MAELGVGSAIVYSMYNPIAENDINTICALLALYKRVYEIICVVVLVIGLLITPFLSYLVKGSYPKEINIYAIFILFLVNSAMSYWPFSYKSSLLLAYQRADIISWISSITQIGTSIIQILILIVLQNYYLYLIIAVVFTLFNNILISYNADRLFPNIKSAGRVGNPVKREIRKNVSGLLIGNICNVTRNAFDNIFISKFLGLVSVAIYSNYYYILSGVRSVMSMISASMLAGVGNSIALEDKHKNYDDMLKLNYLYMLLGGWMSICMLCLYLSNVIF